MIHEVQVRLRPGGATVIVDGQEVNARVRATFKRDGSLSTLRLGAVTVPGRCTCGHKLEDHGHQRGRCRVETDRYEVCPCSKFEEAP